MSRGKTWLDSAYQKHLRSCPDQARDAADLFVRELNAGNKIALKLDSKPDEVERTAKAPDFLYVDCAAGVRVAIEVKRPLLTETVSQHRWQTALAEDIQKCLQGPVRCIIWCDQGWAPPRRTGKERQRRKQMCEEIAGALQREAARMGLRGVLQLQPVEMPWPSVDLSCILGTRAEGVVLTYGERRTVAFWPTTNDFDPADIPPGQHWGLIDLSPADRQRYAAWVAAYNDPRKEAYRRLLTKANRQLRSRRESGYETVFLFDGRLENDVARDRDALYWFHKDAFDDCPDVRGLSPLDKADFDSIQHVVVLSVGWYGVQATALWDAADACLTMPAPSFLPEGWSLKS